MNEMIQRLCSILDVFELAGDVVDIIPCKAGHINDTFIAAVQAGKEVERYTLQRINSVVFPRPDLIMHNIRIVTEAIEKKAGGERGDCDLRPLALVQTRAGESYYKDDDGAYWRCYHYVEGITYNQVPPDKEGLLIAREAAAAFRRFGDHLGKLNVRNLHVTIEDFHNTPVRFARLREAIAGDSHKRTHDASREIESALAWEDLCGAITEPLQRGHIPLRVTHNDTKINNVVFDDDCKQGPKALCVIDLDTVMPGSLLFDFGDLVRSSVCERSEDETDLDTIQINLKIFEALVGGFCTNPGGGPPSLTQSERELLVTACLVITFETAVRFLTDYLMGDVYFRTERPRHNLDRARTQFRLLADMERKRGALEQIITENVQW